MNVRAKVGEVRAAVSDGSPAAWAAVMALVDAMDAGGRSRADPIREVFSFLGDRWTMLILLILGAGVWRQATLRRLIGALAIEGAVSQRILTLKLRGLERDGFVVRSVSGDVPPKVSYALSPRGEALLGEANRLLAWVRSEQAGIAASRLAFDRQPR